MTNVRFHFEDRLRIPDPDFVMFGATLSNGRVRIWASQNLDKASLVSRLTEDRIQDLFDPLLLMPSPAKSITLTVVMNDCVMIEDDTYAKAFARLSEFFRTDEEEETTQRANRILGMVERGVAEANREAERLELLPSRQEIEP